MGQVHKIQCGFWRKIIWQMANDHNFSPNRQGNWKIPEQVSKERTQDITFPIYQCFDGFNLPCI
jgi:hypothetical protein